MRKMFMHNFKTGEMDVLSVMPEDLTPYLPQDSRVTALYHLMMKMGRSKYDAFIAACRAALGTPETNG